MQGGGDIEGSARPAKAEGLVEAGGNVTVIARKQPHLYYTPPCIAGMWRQHDACHYIGN